MSITTEDLQNPQSFEDTIWRLLARGAVDAKHAFKLFSIATVTADGLPDTRTVVLRACNIEAKELCFHTDIRSGKIAHIKKQPEVCLLFWDHKQSLQLRVYGIVSIHHLDEIANHKLATLPQQQLHLYGYTTTPGSNLDTTAYEIFQDKLIKQNFTWVNVQIHTVDALHLGRTGIHTRVRFQYDGGEILSASNLKA